MVTKVKILLSVKESSWMVFAVEQRTFCVSFDRVFVLSVHFFMHISYLKGSLSCLIIIIDRWWSERWNGSWHLLFWWNILKFSESEYTPSVLSEEGSRLTRSLLYGTFAIRSSSRIVLRDSYAERCAQVSRAFVVLFLDLFSYMIERNCL